MKCLSRMTGNLSRTVLRRESGGNTADPADYTALTEQLHGQTIYLAPDSHSYLNPMDLDLSTDVGESPMLMQADFLLSQCELMMASYGNPLMPI